MNKRSLNYRLILVVIVVGLAFWSMYPPQTKINRGLDLKGGIHLVLGAKLDLDPMMNMTQDVLETNTPEEIQKISGKMGIDSKNKNKGTHPSPESQKIKENLYKKFFRCRKPEGTKRLTELWKL